MQRVVEANPPPHFYIHFIAGICVFALCIFKRIRILNAPSITMVDEPELINVSIKYE